MTSAPSNTVAIDTDMIGGNGELLSYDDATATLVVRPELKGGSPHRGWFLFRITGLTPGRAYTLRVVEACWAGVNCYSTGDDRWTHFTDYTKDSHTEFTFRFTPENDSLYVAMMPPYFQSHLDRLIADTADANGVAVRTLWTSEEGRGGRVFEVGDPEEERHVWITARMHAFEAVGSWLADGLIRWAVSGDEDARRLAEDARLHVVPMVDLDSVHIGSSGKHRKPICFSRDLRPHPHWNANKALVREWEDSTPELYLDLHGPHGNESDLYFYTPLASMTTPAHDGDLAEFRGHLFDTLPATMRYGARIHRCPIGPDDEGSDMADAGCYYMHRRYFGKSGLRLSLTPETPWSVPGYTTDVFRQCGAGFGKAISRFLRRSRS